MSPLKCIRHSDRVAVVACPRGQAFCLECRDTTEMRGGMCGYCNHIGQGTCPIQKFYYKTESAG